MSIGHEPTDDNGREIVGWDATNHRPAVPQITSTTQDASGVVYGTITTSGGGGGAITAAANSYAVGALSDGAITTMGTEGDSAITSSTASGTLMAFIKGLLKNLALGQQTKASSLPVTMASDQTPLTTSTGAKTNVASSSSSSQTILAANANRKGAVIYNDSTAVLYLDLSGGTASATSYSVQIGAQGYFELPPPPVYIGAITGIWVSANGNARVTEFS